MVKFKYTILYVKDVKKSVTFYENTFQFVKKFISPENDYAEVNTGETTLSFASLALGKSNLDAGFIASDLSQKPFGIELGFVTDDVDKLVHLAEQNGATIIEAPKQKPWGQIVAYVRDIDGFLIEICTEIL